MYTECSACCNMICLPNAIIIGKICAIKRYWFIDALISLLLWMGNGHFLQTFRPQNCSNCVPHLDLLLLLRMELLLSWLNQLLVSTHAEVSFLSLNLFILYFYHTQIRMSSNWNLNLNGFSELYIVYNIVNKSENCVILILPSCRVTKYMQMLTFRSK